MTRGGPTLLDQFGTLADRHPDVAVALARFDREYEMVHQITLEDIAATCDLAEAGIWGIVALIAVLCAIAIHIAATITF